MSGVAIKDVASVEKNRGFRVDTLPGRRMMVVSDGKHD